MAVRPGDVIRPRERGERTDACPSGRFEDRAAHSPAGRHPSAPVFQTDRRPATSEKETAARTACGAIPAVDMPPSPKGRIPVRCANKLPHPESADAPRADGKRLPKRGVKTERNKERREEEKEEEEEEKRERRERGRKRKRDKDMQRAMFHCAPRKHAMSGRPSISWALASMAAIAFRRHGGYIENQHARRRHRQSQHFSDSPRIGNTAMRQWLHPPTPLSCHRRPRPRPIRQRMLNHTGMLGAYKQGGGLWTMTTTRPKWPI